VLFERDGERFVPTELARGPWDRGALHGGASSALLVTVLERHDPGPADFVARCTVELLRPVPLAPLRLTARTFRGGKKVQWLEGSLFAEDVEVARATVLRLRQATVDTSDAVGPVFAPPPAPEHGVTDDFDHAPDEVGFWRAHDIRFVAGSFRTAGPASAWFNLLCPVIDDEPASPVARVAAAADFGSGIGNPVTFVRTGAINPEITVHLHRHPDGEWVGLESGGFAQPHGVGLAHTRLHDQRGPIGLAAQTLLVEEINPLRGPG
jgi:hypothetical protein